MKLPRFEATETRTGFSMAFSYKVCELELDIFDLSSLMKVPLPGLRIYKDMWSACISVERGEDSWYPTLLLGGALIASLTRAELRAVIAHELAHLGRGDCWRNFLEAVFALLPRPFAWVYAWLLRRREFICDAIAAHYVPADDMIDALIMIHKAPGMLDDFSLMASHPPLGKRIAALAKRKIKRHAFMVG